MQRIAIVEDEHSLREDLVAFFRMRALEVMGFESGEAFLACWPNTPIDLVILDISLPGCSGLEVAEAVRRQSQMPILMLTADSSQHQHLSSLKAGADGFLCKTSSLEIIESTVRNMLLRAKLVVGSTSSMPDATEVAPSEPVTWKLYEREMQLKAPNHLTCKLTYSEVQFLSALMKTSVQMVERERILTQMSKEVTLSNLRNLDTYAMRIRRKTQEALIIEAPIRSAYNSGYMFAANAQVLP